MDQHEIESQRVMGTHLFTVLCKVPCQEDYTDLKGGASNSTYLGAAGGRV